MERWLKYYSIYRKITSFRSWKTHWFSSDIIWP